MAYLHIEDFRLGLDTRKSLLTAPPGSLRVLQDAHLTRGQEVERRKAFAEIAELPAGTSGLHALGDSLHVFGNQDLAASMPVGVTYQRLLHPLDIANATWDGVSTNLDVSSQGISPQAVTYLPGTDKIWVLDANADAIHQYSLVNGSTEGATYDGISFDTSSYDDVPVGLAIHPDGNKVLLLGQNTNALYQFSLSGDLSTLSYDTLLLGVTAEGTATPTGVCFSADGTKIFVISDSGSLVMQYSFNGGFGSTSYDSVTLSLSDAADDLFPTPDGRQLFFVSDAVDEVTQYRTTNYLQGAVEESTPLDISSRDSSAKGVAISESGEKLLVVGTNLDRVVQFSLLPEGGSEATRVWTSEDFAGKIYVVAEFASGQVYHYYDTELVEDWITLAGQAVTESAILSALYARVLESSRMSVTLRQDRLRLTGPVGEAVTISGGTDVTVTEVTAAAAATAEVRATASFDVTGGSPGPTINTIESLLVQGPGGTAPQTDLIGSPVNFVTDNDTTAAALATRINAIQPTYNATSSGNTVTIEAPSGLGASANGRELSITVGGNVTVGSVSDFSGGQDAVDAVAQITDVTIDAVNADRIYEVTIDESDPGDPANDVIYRIAGQAAPVPLAIRAFKQKMYAVSGTTAYFSGFLGGYDAMTKTAALPDPTVWINFDDGSTAYAIGAGVINLAEQLGSAQPAVGLGIYQDRLAIFSQQYIQIWSVDPDPDLNAIYQVLLNFGAISGSSIVEYGDLDVFFLGRSGLRSLRARDSSNLASTQDVGSPVDTEINDYLASRDAATLLRSRAVVEPQDSRYLLSLGSRIYVFSNFSGSDVRAWSTYELDGEILELAASGQELYCRIGDSIRQYGGVSGNEYPPVSTPAVVELPFLDSGDPGTLKSWEGLDLAATGTWKVTARSEPGDPEDGELWAIISGSSYGSAGKIKAGAYSTHISLRLETVSEGPAVLSNILIHHQPKETG